ncbi:MAG: VCBS repeat-containing protein [Planctomycetes bacterium]|nr:VCBS repeat-containing protein [Planctomycetota bacterium]
MVLALPQVTIAQVSYFPLSEFHVDDENPHSGPWIQNYFSSGPSSGALGVASADFDHNGYLDVVMTGNGAVPTRILYLGPNGDDIVLTGVEVLETNSGFLGNPPAPAYLAFPNTGTAYGVDVGDFNGDGWADIAVGRRLSEDRFNNGQTDTIWLNDKTASTKSAPGSTGLPIVFNHCYFDALAPTALQPMLQPPSGSSQGQDDDAMDGETFAIQVANLDGSASGAHDDIVCTGNFGIRLFIGDGQGGFSHAYTFVERDASGQKTQGVYRNVTIADVDSDGDLDLFVTRGPGNASDRVWFNMLRNPFPNLQPGELFAWRDSSLSSGPTPIQRGTPLTIQWREIGSSCGSASGTVGTGVPGSFDSSLGDLDRDGDLDLVIASHNCQNTVYLNNGYGHFGSANVPSGVTGRFKTSH